ncbi:MAG: tRNA (adenosine(37)-N6)-dimethylallyltransferase MiaA [Acidocella sp.]|nr:tRNA (adenosine(37)-N6)-dimethylallyltransferase MiaA [Acidocella sp.]
MSENDAWLGLAFLACAVSSLDDVPVPFPGNEQQIELLVGRLGDSALEAIADKHRRARLPLLVGGTGLYVRAVLDGLVIPNVAPDMTRRQVLEDFAAREGAPALHRRLAACEPNAAAAIPPSNMRRVIRALEVTEATGIPFSAQRVTSAPPFRLTMLGLDTERVRLYGWADQRVEAMLAAGFVAEVRRLLDAGYDPTLPALSSLGYRQIGQALRGEMSLAAAVERVKFDTHRFIRKQLVWFRPDRRIHWLDAAAPDRDAQALALAVSLAAPGNAVAARSEPL